MQRAVPARVYLAGPIFETQDPDTWRRDAAALLGLDVEVLNPRDLEVDHTDPEHIVLTDLEAIRCSTFVLAMALRPSWGTAMELAYAKVLGVPVVSIVTDSLNVSPWLRAHSQGVVTNLGDAARYIKQELKTYENPHYR